MKELCGSGATAYNQVYTQNMYNAALTPHSSSYVKYYLNSEHFSKSKYVTGHVCLISPVIKIHSRWLGKLLHQHSRKTWPITIAQIFPFCKKWDWPHYLKFIVLESTHVTEIWHSWESWRQNTAQPGMGRSQRTSYRFFTMHLLPVTTNIISKHEYQVISFSTVFSTAANKGGQQKKKKKRKYHTKPFPTVCS